MAVKKETEVITIPAIDIRTATITIKGDSPLIVHKRVLSDNELRTNLLLKAKADMQVFKTKYESLEELSDVFRAMDEVIA